MQTSLLNCSHIYIFFIVTPAVKTEFAIWARMLEMVWKLSLGETTNDHLQSSRLSVSEFCVINMLHVKANCLPGSSTDRTQIPAGLFALLMERLNRRRSGVFPQSVRTPSVITWSFRSTLVLQVLYLDPEPLAQPPTKCVWDCTAHLPASTFLLTQPVFQMHPGIVSMCLLSTAVGLR